MSTTLFAFTASAAAYPGYINASADGDHVVIIVRSDPTQVDGVRICGQTCHPGGPGCNNYCNLAPDIGPMADRPERQTYQREGSTASLRLSRADFDRLFAGDRPQP